MVLPTATLDHVVINARDDMDRAVDVYQRLGFTLTERGYHSLGSMNHLAMFGTEYLELIALPKSTPSGRLDLLDYAFGLKGLVFGTEDSAATYAALHQAGVPIDPPVEFTDRSDALVCDRLRPIHRHAIVLIPLVIMMLVVFAALLLGMPPDGLEGARFRL